MIASLRRGVFTAASASTRRRATERKQRAKGASDGAARALTATPLLPIGYSLCPVRDGQADWPG